MQSDWLVAHQSKPDIRNLTFMNNPTSRTRQDQIHMAQSKEVFKFSVQEMLKNLSHNGKHIDLKWEEAKKLPLKSSP